MGVAALTTESRAAGRPLSRAIFFALPLVYSLTFARFWLSDVDEGFLLGLAWRIVHGQLPYRDFIYVRPPLPILLEAAQLALIPWDLQIYVSRVLFYVCVATYSLVSAQLLCRGSRGRTAAIDPYLLAAAAFVFSSHDFPPMAWHTTDGILFATLGVALLVRSARPLAVAAGAASLVLAALCKQPFALIAALGPLLAGALHGRRTGMLAAFWIAAPSAAAFAALAVLGMLPSFVSQTIGGLGAGGGLVASGFSAYLDCSFAPFLVGLSVGGVAREVRRRRGLGFDWGIAIAIGLVFVLLAAMGRAVVPALKRFVALDASYDAFALMWLGAGLAAVEAIRRRTDPSVLAVLLVIAWASGLTWGAQGPSLFATPLLYALLYLACEILESRWVRELQWLLVVGGIAAFSVVYFLGARGPDASRHHPTTALSDLSPRLTFVRGSQSTHRKLAELFDARRRYGPRLAVLPTFALANFLLDDDAALPLDRLSALELDGGREWFERELDQRIDYALLERSQEAPDGSFETPTLERVRHLWRHVETLDHFEVFANPRGNRADER